MKEFYNTLVEICHNNGTELTEELLNEFLDCLIKDKKGEKAI